MSGITQEGNLIDVTLSGTVTKGTIALLDDIAGVYAKSGVSGETVPVALAGVFTLAKRASASDALSVGSYCWARTTGGANVVVGLATGSKPIGIAVAAAATGATEASVKVHPF